MTMLTIRRTARFKKDFKRLQKQGFDIALLAEVIEKLASEEPLDKKYQDHPLHGEWAGFRECHVILISG